MFEAASLAYDQISSLQAQPVGSSSVTVAVVSAAGGAYMDIDYLRRFPTEVRLMIFEKLLVADGPVMLGARLFGALHKDEWDNAEFNIPAAVLLTCRKYHDEAAPILYGKNKLIFCTGYEGKAGMFDRFPVSKQYMQLLTNIGLYFRATDPKADSSIRIGHFAQALARRATNLKQITVCAASDRYYDQRCPYDIMPPDHPICEGVLRILQQQKRINRVTFRLHDGALLFPGFAQYIERFFERLPTRAIVFTKSCSCPPGCPMHGHIRCSVCGRPRDRDVKKPVNGEVVQPTEVEANMERMMDMQEELFQLGILPSKDDDGDDGGSDDDDEDKFYSAGENGVYVNGIPADFPDVNETQPGFYSGWYSALCLCEE